MEFDVSRVYTALDAESLKVGSKVIVADNLDTLKQRVTSGGPICKLEAIEPEYRAHRFVTEITSALAYLVEESAKLKWTDLKVGDVLTNGDMIALVTQINLREDESSHIYANVWIEDRELDDWRIYNG